LDYAHHLEGKRRIRLDEFDAGDMGA